MLRWRSFILTKGLQPEILFVSLTTDISQPERFQHFLFLLKHYTVFFLQDGVNVLSLFVGSEAKWEWRCFHRECIRCLVEQEGVG